jgi:hypothetical protein
MQTRRGIIVKVRVLQHTCEVVTEDVAEDETVVVTVLDAEFDAVEVTEVVAVEETELEAVYTSTKDQQYLRLRSRKTTQIRKEITEKDSNENKQNRR